MHICIIPPQWVNPAGGQELHVMAADPLAPCTAGIVTEGSVPEELINRQFIFYKTNNRTYTQNTSSIYCRWYILPPKQYDVSSYEWKIYYVNADWIIFLLKGSFKKTLILLQLGSSPILLPWSSLFNIMAADALATWVARASAAMILNELNLSSSYIH